MHRAARLVPFMLLATSLAAAADVVVVKDPAAIAAAVEAINDSAPAQQKEWQETRDNLVRTAPERARAQGGLPGQLAGTISNWRPHDDRDFNRDYCRNSYDCPFGGRVVPTLNELRVMYRDVPESDLWNICLGREESRLYGVGKYGACAMISAPDPMRPVELPNARAKECDERDADAAEDETPRDCTPRKSDEPEEMGSDPIS
jgi:hypothetical protein